MRPVCSAAEENVLQYDKDPYRGESILVHELAHSMYVMGLTMVEAGFASSLDAAYKGSMSRGLWKDTYAATSADEYWAEGVQSWFDANLEAKPANGVHNEINTRDELKEYDPALAALIAKVYPDDEWRWSPPKD
jgi:hypothetical protein